MFKREGYVNEAGQPIVHKQIDPKKVGIVVCACVLILTIIIFLTVTIRKSNKNKTCNKIEDAYITAAMKYAEEKNLLPKIETESIEVSGDLLLGENRVNKSDVMLKENLCHATIKITKYHKDGKENKNEYIKSVELKNCGYCTTESRYGEFKTSKKLPSGNVIVELVPTFNYYETKDYYTKWTTYYKEEQLKEEVDEEYGVRLPISENVLPSIPDTGHIVQIEKNDKIYYRYRDRKWKFYRNGNASYSGYSSTQPTGYSKRDDASSRKTDWSVWSLNYPDTASYRTIRTKTGYRWYYKKDGEKIYWKSGEYYPEQPDLKYTEKDGKATMYSYQDIQWRWYNGEKRGYSSYASVMPRNYFYRDEENTILGDWSSWYEVSKLDNTNRYYREQITETRSRYRIKYQVYSFLKLANYVDKETFEKQVGKKFTEFYLSPNIKVDIKYEYKYRKA